jgi:signal transduction histidine kinase
METDWKIYQLIIFNIVQNAIKYNTKEGLITVSIQLENLSEGQGNFVTVIKNTGIGIAKERIPYLFEVFGELKQK